MTEIPSASGTVVADVIATKYVQFAGAPSMEAIIASHAVQQQEIQSMLIDLWVYRTLPYAVGLQLDLLGRIIGESRLGRDDDEYRLALSARVRKNKSNATVEDLIAILQTVDNRDYHIRDQGFASMMVEIMGALGSLSPTDIQTVMQESKAGGVSFQVSYNTDGEDFAFTCAPSDTVIDDVNKGCGNDAGTTGGKLVSVIG